VILYATGSQVLSCKEFCLWCCGSNRSAGEIRQVQSSPCFLSLFNFLFVAPLFFGRFRHEERVFLSLHATFRMCLRGAPLLRYVCSSAVIRFPLEPTEKKCRVKLYQSLLLTPWTFVRGWSFGQEIVCLLRNSNVHYRVHKCLPVFDYS
jgi:hypothetical protein